MEADQHLGWLALALTPGLGARMAGKLLREFGSPEAVFNASLTALEAQHLAAAVAQAIHSREPLSAAAKELAQVQQDGCSLLNWGDPAYPHLLREHTILRPFCMLKERKSFWTGIASRSLARDAPRPMGIK